MDYQHNQEVKAAPTNPLAPIPVAGKWYHWQAGLSFLIDPISFTTRHQYTLGPFYRVVVPLRRLLVTTSPEVIRHVLQTDHRKYIKSPAYRQLKLALGNGLVTSEGDFWFKQRRLMQPAFYKRSLQGIYDRMQEVCLDYCEGLAERLQTQPVDIAREMMDVTSDVVLKALFSVSDRQDKDRLYRQMMDTQDYLMDRTVHPFLIPWYHLSGRHRRFLLDRSDFDNMVYRFIDEHQTAAYPPDDFLTMLLQVCDADTGEVMSPRQIKDEAITMFAAGHETSSTALTWTLYLLSQHPHILARLRAEVDAVIGAGAPTYEELPRLAYTRQVLQEAMRLYPPAYAVGRQAAEDDEIAGIGVPRGTIVFIAIYAIHHYEPYWPEPEKFDPDRFEPGKAKERPPMSYLPFGTGPRMCIGEHFAMMEMQLLLSLLVQRFDFELTGNAPVEMQPMVTLKPKGGMPMYVGRRVSGGPTQQMEAVPRDCRSGK